MTDYDGVRTCCNDKSICKRCWQFIAAAVVVLDASLREDFGFQHLLWVYSGRRGIHCWISDEKARALTDEQRKAIVGWLEVVKGGGQSDKKVNLTRPLHPSLKWVQIYRFCLLSRRVPNVRRIGPWNPSQTVSRIAQTHLRSHSLERPKLLQHSRADRDLAQSPASRCVVSHPLCPLSQSRSFLCHLLLQTSPFPFANLSNPPHSRRSRSGR